MDWQKVIEELKEVKPEFLGERNLTIFKDELEAYLKKVKEELANRIW